MTKKPKNPDAPKPVSDHLREHQWKPGQSGNPNGRPPSRRFKRALMKLLEAAESGETPEFSVDMIAKALFKAAKEGNVQAIREFADRVDGKVAQPIVGSTDPEDGGAILVNTIKLVGVRATRQDEDDAGPGNQDPG